MIKTLKWIYKMGWEHNDRMIKGRFNEMISNTAARASEERTRERLETEEQKNLMSYYIKPDPRKYYAQLDGFQQLYDLLWPPHESAQTIPPNNEIGGTNA